MEDTLPLLEKKLWLLSPKQNPCRALSSALLSILTQHTPFDSPMRQKIAIIANDVLAAREVSLS
jgi:hypothetical protein